MNIETITPEFNDAAAGPTGEPGAVDGSPTRPGPNTPGAASVHAEVADEFASATNTPPIVTKDHSETPDDGPMTVERATAELESLEEGRAKPAPRKNLNPPTKTKKIVDSTWERQREARVRALAAYVEFKRHEPENGQEQEFSEDLEPSL